MEFENLLVDTDGPVATITLNRPEKLNAYTATMGAELAAAFDAADADDAVRVVLVTGAGRGFCAGADISAGAEAFNTTSAEGSAAFGDVSRGRPDRTDGPSMVRAVFECRKPSIAAFNGAAVGVGLTLALPMDIRIAADTAKFGFVFARRGLVPEAGSAWFLPRLVGISQALRWCLDGSVFGAEEALRGGLVSEVTPAEALLPRARAIARAIADNTAPISIALTRQMLWRLSAEPAPWGTMKVDGPLAMALGATDDVREGVQAFLEKRPPIFPGKVSNAMPKGYPWWDR
jgi:enoyl-CoA hydratase/carnithine racemase